jgi:hypothetical protein
MKFRILKKHPYDFQCGLQATKSGGICKEDGPSADKEVLLEHEKKLVL